MLMALYCLARFSPKVTNRGPSALAAGEDHASAAMSCRIASPLSHGPYQLLTRQAGRTASRSISTATSLLQQAPPQALADRVYRLLEILLKPGWMLCLRARPLR